MFPPNIDSRKSVDNAYAAPDKVIVAVKAEKVISKTALAWALTHVVHPGDCITLLAVFAGVKAGRKLWSFPRLKGDCRNDDRPNLADRICQISDSCSQMVLQFQNQTEVMVRIKVVSGTTAGAVTAEAKSNAANWVVLDKKLKQERKHCMEELYCNIVVMNGSKPKVLRLNLGNSDDPQTPFFSAPSSPGQNVGNLQGYRMKHSTPVSSPEEPSTSCTRTSENNSSSSFDTAASVLLIYEQNPLFDRQARGEYAQSKCNDLDDSCGERIITLSITPKSPVRSQSDRIIWIPQNHIFSDKSLASKNPKSIPISELFPSEDFDRKEMITRGSKLNQDLTFSCSIRDAVSLGRTSSVPAPLCTLCQNQAPPFGKPPRRFDYRELQEATDGFSDRNFLAEGGFGLVHRGVLKDGLVVAVKQLKFAGSQGDADFSREVRVLSCAQHRNVVLLVGFCIEGKRRLLVYEYVCNGSLDVHLHGHAKTSIDWDSRLKIAIGTARGLRYLHEDCRVGCIVHRDMRSKNILLTHDFEPLVADFGLVSLHTEWDTSEEEQVTLTSRFLAPEYANGGTVTEKVDIFAFGLVLLELITGRRTSELLSIKARNFLSDIFHPLSALEPVHLLAYKHNLLDPCLASYQFHNLPHELEALGRAASLCLQNIPESRPPMSKVLKILEAGDALIPIGLDLNTAGSQSGRIHAVISNAQIDSRRKHFRRLSQ